MTVLSSVSISDISPELKLRRAALACLLWENSAYSSGNAVVDEIISLIPQIAPEKVRDIAIEARTKQKLRHVPLLITAIMASLPTHKHLVAETVKAVCQRPDELGELLSLYWRGGKQPISSQLKKGMRMALEGYSEYSVSRYQGVGGNKNISLRDIMFLCHAKPKNEKQAELFKALAAKTLAAPDTWETALSAGQGKDKKETWERLLSEKKIGPLALIRNLRNMTDAGVDADVIKAALAAIPDKNPVLPFQYMTSARITPLFGPELMNLMVRSAGHLGKLHGKTVVIVDVSGSMNSQLSYKTQVTRMDTAIALAIILQGVSEKCEIYCTAGSDGSRKGKSVRLSDDIRGLDLIAAIKGAYAGLGGGGIFLKHSIDYAHEHTEAEPTETLVVISDSQDTSGDDSPKRVNPFAKHNYMMDISVERQGIAYNKLTVLNGFSEALVTYLIEEQAMFDAMEAEASPSVVASCFPVGP